MTRWFLTYWPVLLLFVLLPIAYELFAIAHQWRVKQRNEPTRYRTITQYVQLGSRRFPALVPIVLSITIIIYAHFWLDGKLAYGVAIAGVVVTWIVFFRVQSAREERGKL